MAEQKNETIYQLKITLKESKPPIWRRIQVPANITLHKLHAILQCVMGWYDYHLYGFRIAGIEYGIPDPDGDFDEFDLKDSRRARLNKVISGEKAVFTYDYDFGDGWEHQILVEKILPAESGVQYPVCLAGKRACPPEDCGGIGGYEDLLKIIRNPAHEEYEEMMEWLGGPFDPEEFDIEDINPYLARYYKTTKPKRTDVPEVFHRAFEPKDE